MFMRLLKIGHGKPFFVSSSSYLLTHIELQKKLFEHDFVVEITSFVAKIIYVMYCIERGELGRLSELARRSAKAIEKVS